MSVSKADIKINLKGVESGNAWHNAQILGESWFNIVDHPVARFETIEFQQAEEGRYIAIGNLTLSGKTMPVSLPFTLDIVKVPGGERAYVEGQLVLNRLDFGLGGESWKSSNDVAHQVQVNLRLVAENIKNSAN